jgi:hypothetical protein
MPDAVPNPNIITYIRSISFITPENPTQEDIKKFDEEINKFLETMDGTTRVLNGRNSYAVGNRNYSQIWYFENKKKEPVIQTLGRH